MNSSSSNDANTYVPGQTAVLNRVRNLTSSVAGAGSNEVHMFRQRREAETIRLKRMDRELDARTDKVLFEEARAERLMNDQTKTDKKRNKRLRKKEAKKNTKLREKAQKQSAASQPPEDPAAPPEEKKQKLDSKKD